jgi:hypothetical protein
VLVNVTQARIEESTRLLNKGGASRAANCPVALATKVALASESLTTVLVDGDIAFIKFKDGPSVELQLPDSVKEFIHQFDTLRSGDQCPGPVSFDLSELRATNKWRVAGSWLLDHNPFAESSAEPAEPSLVAA